MDYKTLQHYGVLGMRWGTRKGSKSLSNKIKSIKQVKKISIKDIDPKKKLLAKKIIVNSIAIGTILVIDRFVSRQNRTFPTALPARADMIIDAVFFEK